ncbi:hypothetical protein N7466_009069 [Penicillium verhagenii]|uniref:uncharacterized protein n=1 Tax=Penicillium verhagenii TaxID=1562060 RepID=UPI0025458BDF|nr:uncharacterized protein N7466_010405 [Penicillium verhagenii]XP_057019089.1 uncharacterized protein N7466_009069 [Penicillium verhagenii]KAJ5918413.1 hypothetical protein N7466_010405 [Penicillium verhagenii]KAJ5924882.1 hypothetical protein N7466_009069 [Penicillium verhagenii]
MKFSGFSVSLALASALSVSALPTLPGRTDLSALPGRTAVGDAASSTDGTAAAMKRRDGGDALGGAVYGVTGSSNGLVGIVGSAAGTAESTSAGAVGTAESTVAGVVPAKREVPGLNGLSALPGGTVVGEVEGTTEAAVGSVKRDGSTDAVAGAVYGVTSSTNGIVGVAGSAAGTGESTAAGAVGTVESTAAGVIPAKREVPGLNGLSALPGGTVVGEVEGTAEGAAAGMKRDVKRDSTDALTGTVYGVTESTNGLVGIAGSAAGTAETTSAGAVGTVESTVAGVVPAKRQLPGLGNVVDASVQNDLGMLTGNPSGLIGALAGLQTALSTGNILPSQISSLPVEFEYVVEFLYTA